MVNSNMLGLKLIHVSKRSHEKLALIPGPGVSKILVLTNSKENKKYCNATSGIALSLTSLIWSHPQNNIVVTIVIKSVKIACM